MANDRPAPTNLPKLATTVFDLLRHGEPEGGPMFRGGRDDPLSGLGWQQMQAAIGPTGPGSGDDGQWDLILSSPMRRCSRFAETLSAQRGIPLKIEAAMREIGFGAWEGMTAEAIDAEYGDHLTRFWADAEANPPPEGELLSQFQERVITAWDRWAEELAGQRVLLVCHGGVIRVILGQILGIPRQRTLSAIDVPYACRSRVRLDRSPYGLLSCLVSHGPVHSHIHGQARP